VGRCLRAITDLESLGENSIVVDCDVLQADGGTRTAAITASYVALVQAFHTLVTRGILSSVPLIGAIAATSVGIIEGEPMLDLCYEEDCRAEVDFNVALTNRSEYVEIQGTAEGKPFPRTTANALLDLAEKGINQLFQVQRVVLKPLKHF
ncbi:MAG: ribonuclease PH, partial [Chloroflexi bacterium]|nr:ribonuclease PH [Chloroflexota bacterium]